VPVLVPGVALGGANQVQAPPVLPPAPAALPKGYADGHWNLQRRLAKRPAPLPPGWVKRIPGPCHAGHVRCPPCRVYYSVRCYAELGGTDCLGCVLLRRVDQFGSLVPGERPCRSFAVVFNTPCPRCGLPIRGFVSAHSAAQAAHEFANYVRNGIGSVQLSCWCEWQTKDKLL